MSRKTGPVRAAKGIECGRGTFLVNTPDSRCARRECAKNGGTGILIWPLVLETISFSGQMRTARDSGLSARP